MRTKEAYLVTGASGGIGEAIAARLHLDGSVVVGTYNTGTARAESMEKRYPGLRMIQVNLTSRDQINGLINQLSDYITLKGIVNNAATLQPEDTIRASFSAWDETIKVNLSSMAMICYGLQQRLMEDGSIVNISSIDGLFGSADSIAYAVSKAGVISLSRSLACALGPRGVRVNAIAPGWTDTGFSPIPEEVPQRTPLRRVASSLDIANAVQFLLSPQAAFITGTTLVVDGGYSCAEQLISSQQ